MGGITGLQVAGENITSILNYWADIGVFAYVLPFLLIFAVVYGILSKSEILAKEENKGVNAVIAIAIGLLALQWDYVPIFFAKIFPFAGIGISILLVAMILMGLFGGNFVKDKKITTFGWIFFGIGAAIAVVVILSSFSNVGYTGSYWWWDQYGSAIITLIILAVLIGLVLGPKKNTK